MTIKKKAVRQQNYNYRVGLAFFVLAMLLIFTFSSITYFTAVKIVNETKQVDTEKAVLQSSAYINSYLNNIKSSAKTIEDTKNIKEYLKKYDENASKDFFLAMDLIKNSDSNIKSIKIVSKEGFYLTDDKRFYYINNSDRQTKWYEFATNNNVDFWGYRDNKDEGVLVKRVLTDANGEVIGVVIINVDFDFINWYTPSLFYGKKGYAFLRNNEGNVIFCNCKESIEEKNYDKHLEDNSKGLNTKKGFFTSNNKIAFSNFSIEGFVSSEDILIIKDQIINTIIYVNIILIVLSIIIAIRLSKSLTKPIRKLRFAIQNVSDNLEHIDMEEENSKEINDLADEYNSLINRVKLLTNKMIENENIKREFELKALQSQINPHFLYNTLDTIVWLAEFEENEKVVDVSKALGEMLHLSLNIDKSMVELREELKNTQNYLTIQQERYEKIKYTITGDKSLLSVNVPKLILQPIVENAIYHGLKYSKTGYRIDIKYWVEDENLIITVEDDGIGYDPDKKKDSALKIRTSGIGMQNVNQRIKIMMGDDYGLSIKKGDKVGTIVTYKLKL